MRIKNYRSFDDNGVEIDFPDLKVPISLVGHNNSGKSNFIAALLYGLSVHSVYDNTFTLDDYYLRDEKRTILIEVHVDPPLMSSDAYNTVKEMPILQLRASIQDGDGDVKHSCCDAAGKPIFNPRAMARSKKKSYTDEERAVLNESLKRGAETVSKWRSKIPIFYIDTKNIDKQLKPSRYTLLGKVLSDIRKEFESWSSLMEKNEGVVPSHIGKSRIEIFEKAMEYLESHVLPTKGFAQLVGDIERVVKHQLEIEAADCAIEFGQPSADYFFDNLTFFIRDHADKPRLPITNMGNGFVSLFAVALIRAIVKSDEGGNIFIIEEPETFQHEHFQEYFYKVLCEVAEKNQVIYTTHSKKFVNVFCPESIIRFSNPDRLFTRITYNHSPQIEYPEELDGFSVKTPEEFGKYLRTLEPNIGNIVFARKVLIVEGPHDLLAYRTVIDIKVNLGLNNIAIVAAWGKDSVITIVQLCKRFDIPYFVVHDWDLSDPSIDISKEPDPTNAAYQGLVAGDKGQYTRNWRIRCAAGSANVHHNKRNLEEVLGIPEKAKAAASVYERVSGKSFDEVVEAFPDFFPDSLRAFLDVGPQ